MNTLSRPKTALFLFVVIISLGGILYYHRDKYELAYEDLRVAVGLDKPCDKPILYSIGQYDSQFGLDKAKFIEMTAEAARLWDGAMGKTLLAYSEESDLKINLIYDSRQRATQELQTIDSVIDIKTYSYDQWKAEYDELKADLEDQKTDYERSKASYDARRLAYQEQVSYWNGRGGANKSQFADLEIERQALNHEAERLNAAVKALNGTVERFNSTARMLNTLGKDINRNVSAYNEVSTSNGPEFGEGEYIRDQNGERINIYQYDDRTKLVRVLAHEFGHALGVGHVNDPAAIMYMINKGKSTALTTDDISAINAVCSK